MSSLLATPFAIWKLALRSLKSVLRTSFTCSARCPFRVALASRIISARLMPCRAPSLILRLILPCIWLRNASCDSPVPCTCTSRSPLPSSRSLWARVCSSGRTFTPSTRLWA
ncbi:hypothetical protein D3C80_1029980 [compost metagenome]